MQITMGFAPKDRARVGALYWEAFGAKLGKVMGPEARALALIDRVLDPGFAICAYEGAQLLGVAGFKTYEGALAGGGLADLRAVYGPLGALWRAAALALLEREVESDRFLMDGIFVAPEARGRGVGTALLEAVCAEGARRGYGAVRLDVIDSNPRARALYERKGFAPVETQQLGPLRWIFGFASATAMERALG